MSRYKNKINAITAIMPKTDFIRNVGIVAHIDHGKTTLSDSLLSAVGYLSDELAGTVRALDYLDEEQKRGITIKTANISLLYQFNSQDYLVNLVDTPGHVDFTGSVTRALRIIDGVIVVVDAVEEIMVQTETVTRQALSEYIKPILFINKIDRLIDELRLTNSEIQKKLQRIILEFNNLIETYSLDASTKKWKVNTATGSVMFGSAIDKWGFNYDIFSKKNLKFDFIIQKYRNKEKDSLRKLLPIAEPVFQGIIRNLPSPIEAQKYRIKKIWLGDIESEAGEYLSSCDINAPVILFVSKINYDPQAKFIATARVFSGTLKQGQNVVLLSDYSSESINKIYLLMGASKEQITTAPAGNIIAIGGLQNIKAGETIVEAGFDRKTLPFEQIKYFSEPVVTISIEPNKLSQLPEMLKALNLIALQDPNLKVDINEETGEYLISGLGELHLEIVVKKLKEKGFDIIASEPMVVYRETITSSAEGSVAGISSVKEIHFALKPIPDEPLSFLSSIKVDSSNRKAIHSFKRVVKHDRLLQKTINIFPNENILINNSEIELSDKLLHNLVEILQNKLKNGILCEEPIRGIMIIINKIEIDEKNLNLAELLTAVNDLFNKLYQESKPTILEPLFKIQVTVPKELVGKVTTIINQRKGYIKDINELKNNVIITGLIPVKDSFGLAMELRSKTSGRAFWQTQFYSWQPVPKKELDAIITSIRKRKGL
ncbi:MAG: GTP-binding protein [Candidatus Odinarchaeia archaeon]